MTAFVPKSSTKPALGDVFSVCELNNEFQGGQLLLQENSQGISQSSICRVHLVRRIWCAPDAIKQMQNTLKQTNQKHEFYVSLHINGPM